MKWMLLFLASELKTCVNDLIFHSLVEMVWKSGELCKYWQTACDQCRVWGWCRCDHRVRAPAVISRSPGSQFLSGGQTGDTWTRELRPHVSVHNKRQHQHCHWYMGRKYGLGPPAPVSPCHRQSVNWVLGSEEQNLFYPPGRQCQCFRLDLSPQHDH